MATGRSNQLTKQVGEYLVAAELGRLGLIAATFAGSVPDYDIVATDAEFRVVFVQVKAVTGTSWQFNIRRFVTVHLDGKKQVFGPLVSAATDIVCVMVALAKEGQDRFYVLSWEALRDLVVGAYQKFLAGHGGVRPKRPDSFHCALNEKELAPFRNAWVKELHEVRGLSLDRPVA